MLSGVLVMGEATFSVSKVLPPECDYLDCFRPAGLEVSLIGSTVAHAEVCRFHKVWAKKHLIERHLEQEAEREQRRTRAAQEDGTTTSQRGQQSEG